MQAIIQARMSSTRLPGKVLKLINSRPLIQYTIERLQACPAITAIVIATSTESSDLPLIEYCEDHHLPYYRGSLKHVAQRFVDTLTAHPSPFFLRVNADSPLLAPELIEQGLKLFIEGNYQLVSNTYPERTYPIGQSIEIIDSKTFIQASKSMKSSQEIQHITQYFYQQAHDFKIGQFKAKMPLNHYRLVVDTVNDFKQIKHMFQNMNKAHIDYSLQDLIQLYEQVEPC